MRWFEETDSYRLATPAPSSRKRTKQEGYLRLFAMANKMDCYWDLFVKGYQNEADVHKKSAVPTCDTECPCGFQFVSEDSRFRSSADSRACLMALSVKLHRKGCKTYPTASIPFTTVGCAFRCLRCGIDGNCHLSLFGLTVKSVSLWDLRKPTYRKREQPQWSVHRRLNRTVFDFRRWHSSLRLFPR